MMFRRRRFFFDTQEDVKPERFPDIKWIGIHFDSETVRVDDREVGYFEYSFDEIKAIQEPPLLPSTLKVIDIKVIMNPKTSETPHISMTYINVKGNITGTGRLELVSTKGVVEGRPIPAGIVRGVTEIFVDLTSGFAEIVARGKKQRVVAYVVNFFDGIHDIKSLRYDGDGCNVRFSKGVTIETDNETVSVRPSKKSKGKDIRREVIVDKSSGLARIDSEDTSGIYGVKIRKGRYDIASLVCEEDVLRAKFKKDVSVSFSGEYVIIKPED